MEGYAEDNFAEEKNICYAVTFGTFHCGRDYKQKDAWNVYDAMWLPCGSHLNTQFHFLLHLLALADGRHLPT